MAHCLHARHLSCIRQCYRGILVVSGKSQFHRPSRVMVSPTLLTLPEKLIFLADLANSGHRPHYVDVKFSSV